MTKNVNFLILTFFSVLDLAVDCLFDLFHGFFDPKDQTLFHPHKDDVDGTSDEKLRLFNLQSESNDFNSAGPVCFATMRESFGP